jgi:hypothetical protein
VEALATWFRPNRRNETKRPHGTAVWPRAGWLLLVAIHLPGILAAAGGLSTDLADLSLFVRLLGMSASCAFFVAKFLDVPALRFRPGWQTQLVLLLVIILLHVGVIARAMDADALAAGDSPFAQLSLICLLSPAVVLAGCLLRALVRFLRALTPTIRPLAEVQRTGSLRFHDAWRKLHRQTLAVLGPQPPPYSIA